MRRSIFYSWQSDLDNGGNRNLIEDALKRALKAIRRDDSETVEPVLDRDTVGLAGSPSISESIFAKICLADVFVADVSIINIDSDNRKMPNPNVLIELGYAIAQLGWDRVLLIQNTAFGGPEELPFDLRGRRIVPYTFDLNKAGDRSEVRGVLQGRIETALRAALNTSTQISLPTGTEASLWWGKWNIEDLGQSYGGQLFIRDVGAAGFLFDLSVHNGSHLGSITAYARIVSTDVAYARVPNGDSGEIGEITFRRDIHKGRRTIRVDETASCSWYHGMGAFFAGNFTRTRDSLFDLGILNEMELARLYSISGQFYDSLRQRFQGLSESGNLDDFLADVRIGGVRGLYTIMEGILMRGPSGELWVAFIDDEIVRYFTTQSEWKDKLPKTIEAWRERFQDKEVAYHHVVDVIPKNEY